VAIEQIRLNKEDRGYKRRMKAAVMELRNLNGAGDTGGRPPAGP
jgi:hypothetical protein